MKKNETPTEAEECYTLVQYLDARKLLYSHLAQSTFTKSWTQKAKNKRLGVHKGVPDYMIIVPDQGLLFIEMKRSKGGVVSPEQKQWIDELNAIKGVGAFICTSADGAIGIIEHLLSSPKP